MAKKKKTTKKAAKVQPLPENSLPQNILPVGERVEENKNIYISQPVYKEIHKFTKNKTTDESGGMLIGQVIEEFGKTNIVINGFIEAKFCDATPTTLKFTHETWDHVHKQMEKKFPKQKIVGWIHTHPNFGIFLSEYDTFIQENFFREEYQVAYVVDPIQQIEGFYFWINDKIERCKGFYLFDKTGTTITPPEEPAPEEERPAKSGFDYKGLIISVLAVCMILLGISNLSLNSKLSNYKKQTDGYIQSFYQQIGFLNQRVTELEAQLAEEEEPMEEEQDADEGEQKK